MRLSISHTTRYGFSQPVAHGLQRLRLTPKSTHGQNVIDWTMDFDGVRLEAEYDDHHRNRTALVSVEPGTTSVTVVCSGTVDTADNAGIVGEHIGHLPLWHYLEQTELIRPGPKLRALVAGDGGRVMELNTLGPGELFGELMLSGEPRTATAALMQGVQHAQA